MTSEQYFKNGELLSTGQEYAQFILDMWKESSELSIAVSEDMISKRNGEQVDGEILVKFTAKLVTLWKQLCPKIKGNELKGDINLKEDFMRFEKYRTDPKQLLEESTQLGTQENIFKLEDVVRRAIEQLGITNWD